jgi:hydrogenase maturation protein HypF
VLQVDLERFDRLAWLDPVPLPGGERAIHEPWRTAAAYLERAGRSVPWERWRTVRQSLAVNAPLASGAGRLFDAVAALLGVREVVSYEGQAAVELEQLAGEVPAAPYACRIVDGRIVGADLVAAACDDLADGRPRDEIAAAFHEGVAQAFAAACGDTCPPHVGTVVVSGGSFQNLRLLDSTTRRLRELGLDVLEHRRVPPNDAAISVGQAAVAAARMSTCA